MGVYTINRILRCIKLEYESVEEKSDHEARNLYQGR